MHAVIHAAQLSGQGADVTSGANGDMERGGVLIYDNSYNMPPVTHYHPHQTTMERQGLQAAVELQHRPHRER